MAVNAHCPVDWIDLSTQKPHREGALFAVERMKIVEPKCQFGKEK